MRCLIANHYVVRLRGLVDVFQWFAYVEGLLQDNNSAAGYMRVGRDVVSHYVVHALVMKVTHMRIAKASVNDTNHPFCWQPNSICCLFHPQKFFRYGPAMICAAATSGLRTFHHLLKDTTTIRYCHADQHRRSLLLIGRRCQRWRYVLPRRPHSASCASEHKRAASPDVLFAYECTDFQSTHGWSREAA